MGRAEPIFSLFLLVASIVFFLISFQYEMISPASVIGSAFLPSIVAISLIILLGFHVTSTFRGNSNSNEEIEEAPTKAILKKQILLGIMLIVSLFLTLLIGMLGTMGIFLVIALHYLSQTSWLRSTLLSIVTIVLLNIIFVQWMNVPLPTGLLV